VLSNLSKTSGLAISKSCEPRPKAGWQAVILCAENGDEIVEIDMLVLLVD
jgi:hypothetical protein